MRTLFGLTLCCILLRSLLFAEVRQAHVDPHTIPCLWSTERVSVSRDSPPTMGYRKRGYYRLCRTIRASCGLVHSMG